MTETETEFGAGTPWHLWIIALVGLFFTAMGAFDHYMTLTRNEAYLEGFPKPLLDYWFSVPIWVFFLSGGSIVTGLVGSILLLLRNKLVVPFFAVTLLLVIASLIYSFVNPPPSVPEMPPSWIAGVIAVVMTGLFYLYARWMRNRGVLR